jgi:hypothetical protein
MVVVVVEDGNEGKLDYDSDNDNDNDKARPLGAAIDRLCFGRSGNGIKLAQSALFYPHDPTGVSAA